MLTNTINTNQSSKQTSHPSIIFIDPTVADYQSLIAGIQTEAEVILLDPTKDGVAQITAALVERTGISSIHIISHGSAGSLRLGSGALNEENLTSFNSQFQQWKNALTEEADILLYGCDVAAGEIGESFVQRLSEITGADVAASTDKTGNAALGGDWELEKTTGQIETSLAVSDEVTATYAGVFAEPQFAWAKRMGGNGDDYSKSIVVDSSGNIYTTGYFQGTVDFDPGAGIFNLTSAGGNDGFISKLNPDGSFAWAKKIGGSGYDYSYSIVVDSSGDVYTTGSFSGTVDFDPGAGTYNLTSAGGDDGFISKLNPNGSFAWAKQLGGSNYDQNSSIAVDSSGNVYTTGYFQGTGDFDPGAGTFNLTSAGQTDGFISKLNPDGSFAWAKQLRGSNYNIGHSITVDSSGNVYTTGYFYDTVDFDPGVATYSTYNLTSAGSKDSYISKLNPDGSFAWAKQLGGIIDEFGYGITVDSSGNVYTTGLFEDTVDFDPGAGTYNLTSAGGYDSYISKLNPDGSFVWAKQLGGSVDDIGQSIAVDSSGNVYTTGLFSGTADFDPGAGYNLTSAGSKDSYISKLNPDGSFAWAKQLGGSVDDIGYSIAVDSSGNVYTTGIFENTADFDPGAGTYNLTAAGLKDSFISKLYSGLGSTVTSISSTVADGSYKASQLIPITVTFSAPVTVTGTPTLALNTGGTATYISGSGTDTLTFNYTIAAGQYASDLDYASIYALSLGGTIRDSANNDAILILPSPGAANSLGANKNIILSAAPIASSFTPADNATAVAIGANLIINFDEAIKKGTGNIVIKIVSTDQVVETINVTSTNITVSGNTLTINPTANLAESTKYYVEIANGVIKDLDGNNYAGIIGSTAWNFTTGDTTIPTATSFTPADNATNIGVSANLVVTFSEDIQKGTGNIVIKKVADDSVVETINVISSNVTVSGSTVTINPTADLAEGTQYYVEFANGAIQDFAGNNYTGTTGTTAWNFTTADFTPPTATSFTPVDNASNIAVGANLVVTFSEAIQKGTGNIVIKKVADNSVVETINVTSTNVTVSGSTVTINPTANLAENTQYYVEITNGAIKDLAGNNYAGITGATAWNFTTSDVTAPTINNFTPTDNATGIAVDGNLAVAFSEDIQKGTGNIVIKKVADNSVVETIDITSSNVTVSGSTITINPTADLAEITQYYVEIDNGAIQDLAGNNYTGITGTTAWNFTTIDSTAPDAPVITSISSDSNISGDGITNDPTLQISGTAEADSTINLFQDGTPIGSTNSDATGNWTFDYSSTSLADGTYNFTATANDAVNNTSSPSAPFNVTVDTTAPTVTINQDAGQPDPTGGSTVNFAVVFSETVTEFDGSDITLGGTAGATTATVTGSGATYNVAVTGMNVPGTVTATVKVDTAKDTAGNTSTASTSSDNEVSYDNTFPTVSSITRTDAEISYASTVSYSVIFSENVTGVDVSDFNLVAGSIADAAITNVNGTGDTYTVTVNTGTGDGTVQLNLNDNDSIINSLNTPLGGIGTGNGSSTGQIYTVDKTGAIVTKITSTIANGNYSIGQVIPISVTFGEVVTVTGTPQLILNSGGSAGYASGTGTNTLIFNYTVAAEQNSADLEATAVTLAGGKITDFAGNNANLTLPAPGTTSSLGGAKNIAVDTSAPTITLATTATNVSAAFNVSATFSENVTGFDSNDISITNGTISKFTGNGSNYNFTVTATENGEITINIPANIATDAAGNNNTSTALTTSFDSRIYTWSQLEAYLKNRNISVSNAATSVLIELINKVNPLTVEYENYELKVTYEDEIPFGYFGILPLITQIATGVTIPISEPSLTISDLNTATPTYGVAGKINFEEAANDGQTNFLDFINEQLKIKEVELETEVTTSSPPGVSATASLSFEELTLLKIGSSSNPFSIELAGAKLNITADGTSPPAFGIGGSFVIKGYDPFQANEPALTFSGGLAFDPKSITGALQLTAETPWRNPFGLPDSEIRNLALQVGGTYAPPWIDNVGFVGDLRFGNFDVKSAFFVSSNDPDKFAVEFTAYKPINIVDLWTGPISSYLIKQVGKEINLVSKAESFLKQTLNVTIVSVDGLDANTELDPLLKLVPEDTQIAETELTQGIGINGKVSAWGKEAILSLSANPYDQNDPSLEGFLQLPEIDLGFLKLTGADGPNDKTLDFAVKVSPSEQYLKADGRLDLFGTTIAKANVEFSNTSAKIKDFDLNFGLVALDIDNFSVDIANKTASGSGAVKILGREIANASIKADSSGFKVQGNLDLFGIFSIENAIIDIKSANDIRIGGTAKIFGQDLANANISIQNGQLSVSARLGIDLPIIGNVGANLTITSDGSISGSKVTVGYQAGPLQGSYTLSLAPLRSVEDLFENIVGGAIDSVTHAVDTAVNAVVNGWNSFSSGVVEIFNQVGQAISQAWDDVKRWVTEKINPNEDLTGNDNNNSIDGRHGNDRIWGLAGDDRLLGGSGDDQLFGGVGNDQLIGQSENDRLYGEDGNDLLYGEYGNDFLYGDNYQDKLEGGDGDDFLSGGQSDDFLYGNDGNDNLQGDDGNDLLEGWYGDDVLEGGNGNDRLYGYVGNDQLRGGGDNDELHGWEGNDVLYGGSGNDVLYGQQNDDVLYGGEGNDVLYGEGNGSPIGSSSNDALYGEGGNDYLFGGVGNDYLDGGEGNDVLYGGEGNDNLIGGNGNDVLYGEAGDDKLNGNSGNDYLEGGDGNDSLNGGQGNDTVYGQGGNDSLDGSDGNDYLNGGNGNDSLYGQQGDDILKGEAGNDYLAGSSGNDLLNGGEGDDSLYGDGDNDTLSGGNGRNVIDGGTGLDTADYRASVSSITVNLSSNQAIFAGNVDRLVSIENIIGSNNNDSIVGDSGINILSGLAGDDSLNGLAGDDQLIGDSGNDLLFGSLGDDILKGGSGNDSLYGQEGDDLLEPGAGNDFIDGGDGDDILLLVGKKEDYQFAKTVAENNPNEVIEWQIVAPNGDVKIVKNVENFEFKFDPTPTGSWSRQFYRSRAIDGYIANGKVFFDANLNGVFDDNEPFTITRADGSIDLNVEVKKFDTNQNGKLDDSEGQFVLMGGMDIIGGVDIATGLPMATPLVSTLESTVITPLTTLIAELVQQGIDPETAETRVKAALGLPSGVDLGSYDPLEAIANGDAQGISVFGYMIMVQNTIVQSAKFIDGVSETEVAHLAFNVIDAMAGTVGGGSAIDLGKAEIIQAILQQAITKASQSDPQINPTQLTAAAAAAAQVMALGNQIVKDLIASGRPIKDIASEITKLQAVSVGQIAIGLPELAAGTVSVEEFLANNTKEAILSRMAKAQVKDPTIRPDPFAENLSNFGGNSSNSDTFSSGGSNNNNDDSSNNPGSDSIPAASENDFIMGTPQKDYLNGYAGHDTIFGAPDDDLVFGSIHNDLMNGNQGNDFLNGNQGNDTVHGGQGDDLVHGGQNDDLLCGDKGNDTVFGDLGNDTTYGGVDNDLMNGNKGDDILNGNQGNDTVFGGQGNDLVYGGQNDDLLLGDKGNDTVFGDLGNDTAYGGADNDLMNGNQGNDILNGNQGNDTVFGGQGNDLVYGGQDNDELYGSKGNDTVVGDKGDDLLFGNQDNDLLNGGEGNDTLYGGKENDTLIGGVGDDLISGDLGDDTLTGGEGVDRFLLSVAQGSDVITDFTNGVDLFALSGGLTFNQLSITAGNGSTLISVGNQLLATVNGVQSTVITADDFALIS